MKTLIAILIFQYILRLSSQSSFEAAGSSALLAIFMAIAYRWGGWTSPVAAARWLKARPLMFWLISTGVTGLVILAVVDQRLGLTPIIAEAFGSYFVFHAFCAVGDTIIRRLKYNQRV